MEWFGLEHHDFFRKHPEPWPRWEAMRALFDSSPNTARVLFLVEIAALIDKWSEPSLSELDHILRHIIAGGDIAINNAALNALVYPVWPLEVAKHDVLLLRTFCSGAEQNNATRFKFTYLKAFANALTQTWWALETLVNEFAHIIEGAGTRQLTSNQSQLLREITLGLSQKGIEEERGYFQPIEARLQFIYQLLTGEALDRTSSHWMHLVELRQARDTYAHRIGKPSTSPFAIGNPHVVFEGMQAVQQTVSDIFAKTPEFSARFVYRFFQFWSCKCDSPFIWDSEGSGEFYLGLGRINVADILRLHSQPGLFRMSVPQISPAARR